MLGERYSYWVRGWTVDACEEAGGVGAKQVFVADKRSQYKNRLARIVNKLKERGANLVQVQIIPRSGPLGVEVIEGDPRNVIEQIRVRFAEL